MWCEANCCACAVDLETAYLVQEGYVCGQIDRRTAGRLWWAIVGFARQNDSESRLLLEVMAIGDRYIDPRAELVVMAIYLIAVIGCR